MKFTLNWLFDYLDTDASLEEITGKLTAIGLEVEGVTDAGQELKDFEVAQILDASPHPNAEKLQICNVKTSSGELQIVCGAANAKKGINVVLAPIGSVIPTNGMKIKKSKIRDIESNGMLCSAAELGIGEDSQGIIEMPKSDTDIGLKYASVAGLDDPVIEIAITPNRGDCLGVYGIARDLAAAGLGKLKDLEIAQHKGSYASPAKITTEDTKLCPLIMGRHFRGVKNSPSPEWMQNRLRAIGVNPISALVDITNYISYSFGRPLHVYDAHKLKGDLRARCAADGEKITALNEQEYELGDKNLVIADDSKPQAIAGIIGALDSGCSMGTTEVMLEVALFDADTVASTGRQFDIITDSRYRFERKVDPEFLCAATSIATNLILELCSGEASEVVISGEVPKYSKQIDFDFSYTKKLSGVDIGDAAAQQILQNLGFTVKGNLISVPSWRPDVEGKADIVEEILRIHGYDKIEPLALEQGGFRSSGVLNDRQKKQEKIRRCFASLGLREVITWSFMNHDKAALFTDSPPTLRIKNPINSELDTMRPTIMGNLLDAAGKNKDRGFDSLAFFEIGSVFEGDKPEQQKLVASAIKAGKNNPRNIYGDYRDVDVFDAKADVLCALSAASAPVDNLRIDTSDIPSYYHPGRCGLLKLGKDVLACFGEINPKVLSEFGIKMPVVGCEIYLDNLPVAKAKKSKSRKKLNISDYQSSNRDFAFIFDKDKPAAEILRVVKNTDKNLIKNVSIFDIYQGEAIGNDKKSCAVNVFIQPKNATLTEKELDTLSDNVIAAVQKIGGTLRS